MMLLMQFQASLGMCLQDSKPETGPGTSCTLGWKRFRESKTRSNKGLGDTEWEKPLESDELALLIYLTSRGKEAQRGVGIA